MDAGTLKDYLEDVINERNQLLREVESLKERIAELVQTFNLPWER